MTAKVQDCVRFRRTDENGKPMGGQGVFRCLVGLKVREAIQVLESRFGYPTLYQPMAVNGVPTHRRAAKVLWEDDVLTADP